MLYKFRWVVAVLFAALLLVFGSVIDLVPRWHALSVARDEVQKLNAKLKALPVMRHTLSASVANSSKHYYSPMMTRLAVQHNVTINNVTESSGNHLHVVARGSYVDMLHFLNALLAEYAVALPAFSYQAIGNNEVRFIGDMAITPLSAQSNQLSLITAHNPFCGQSGGAMAAAVRSEQQGISLDLQNSNLSDTVRMLAKMIDRNVMVSPAVEGRVTLHLQHAQPLNVFELLLDSYGLETLQRGNVWYVAPRDELIKRKQQEVKWQVVSSQSKQLVTETWQIHYAKAEDIARLLREGKVSFLSGRGQVRVDVRTNVICIQDVPERMTTIRKLVAALDKPAQQVRIEARLASVDHDVERELGVDFDVQSKGATNPAPGRYSVAVARLPDGSQLDVKLAALEVDGRAELISSPSLYTSNQQPAAIEAGEEVPYQEVSESGGTAVAFKKAVLGLKVTPQVLPGNYVLLQLRINQDRPGSRMVLGMPTISTRQILTSVLVKSGQTAVLGGIYESQDEKAVRRIPLLGSVPVLGELFTLRASRQTKRELLIFVTPKIMKQLP